MINFYKTPTKLEALNEKFNEFENRFQLKLDEQNTAHKIHIQKLDDKIARLEEENSRTFELIDKLYEYRFQEINNNIAKLSEQMSGKLNQCISVYDNKLENTFTTLHEGMQNIHSQINVLNKNQKEIFIEIQKLKNNASNNFEEQINTLTKQQESTNEKLVALTNTVFDLDDKIDVNVCELYEKIDELEEKHSLTGELLLDVHTHSKIGNTSQQNLNNKISEKINVLETRSSSQFNFNMNISDNIKKITDTVSNIQNIHNKFDREIHTLTTHQHITSENLNALQHTNSLGCIDTSIITDKLEICMNAIKKINVFEEPMFGRNLNKPRCYIGLGTSSISIDNEPYEFSYINQFYNLKVLVINNWRLFNYGIFDGNMRNTAAGNFEMMRDRYGEMDNQTLETFIIHTVYDFKTWNNPYDPETSTRREPLLLEYLCMQLKKFPSLKIVKLYYLDLPLNIEDIIINNLENMTHTIHELHIISNSNIIESSRLKRYCDNKKILLKGQILQNKELFVERFRQDVIIPLNQQRIDEDGEYMRTNKAYKLNI